MRLAGFLILCCLAMHSAFAAESNLTLTVDSVTYSNVTFGTVTPSSVTIFYRTGIARIPLEKLPPELQKQFSYDPQKAADWQKREQQATAERQKAEQQRALREKLSKTPLAEPLKVGMVGVSRNGEFKVVQVVGPNEMLAEISTEYETEHVAEQWVPAYPGVTGMRGHTIQVQGPLVKDSKPNEVWVKGISTAGLIDGVEINRKDVFKVTGTKTYTTGMGVTTVFMLEPVTSVSPP